MGTYKGKLARLQRLIDEMVDEEEPGDTNEEFIDKDLDVFEIREARSQRWRRFTALRFKYTLLSKRDLTKEIKCCYKIVEAPFRSKCEDRIMQHHISSTWKYCNKHYCANSDLGMDKRNIEY